MRTNRPDPSSPRRHAVRFSSAAALCLITAVAGIAAEPVSDNEPTNTGVLSGRVLFASDARQEGMPGVELVLDDADPETTDRRTHSDLKGRFSFTGLAPARYQLRIFGRDFEPIARTVDVAAGEVTEVEIPVDAVFSASVTVTATRSERRSEDVPAALSIVDREQLAHTPMSNIKDALEGMPSTLIGAKSQGYDARLIIRGAGLKARYGMREIMVLLNGVPITDPDSFTRLDFIDTQLIDRVEVVRGPNSTLWGINATGGTVNVITRSPDSGGGGSVTADAGSFGASSYQLDYSGALSDRHLFSVDLSHREADNDWRPHNEFDTTQLSLQPLVVLGDDAVLETYLSYTEADLQLPGWLIVNPDREIDQWTPFVDRGVAEETAEPWRHSGRNSEIVFLSSRLRTHVGSLRVEPVIFVNSWTHFHPVTGKINDADTVVGGIDVPLTWEHGLGSLTGGVTARFDRQDSTAYTYADVVTTPSGRILRTASDRPGELMEASEQLTSLYGAYAQETLRIGDRWVVDLGLRIDHIRFDISGNEWIAYDYGRGSYGPGEGVLDSLRSYTPFSPRVAAVLRLNRSLHLYGNVSTGAQTPTFSELTTNPDLKLTRVVNYELGLKARFSSLRFDAAIFNAKVRDEVVQVIQDFGYSEYVNAGSTDKLGAELSLSATPWTGVTLGCTYAYSDYEYVDFSEPAYGRDIDRSGNRLPLIPKHQVGLFAWYQHRTGLSLRASANSWGEYYVDNANSETYPGFSLVTDLSAAYTWRWLEMTVMVQNLFDDRYAIEVQKDLYGSKRFAPAAPRSLRARVALRF